MPYSGGGALDRRQIHGFVRLLLFLLGLLWLELSGRRSSATFFNNLVATDLFGWPGGQEEDVLRSAVVARRRTEKSW
jgi:hypothetical protein